MKMTRWGCATIGHPIACSVKHWPVHVGGKVPDSALAQHIHGSTAPHMEPLSTKLKIYMLMCRATAAVTRAALKTRTWTLKTNRSTWGRSVFPSHCSQHSSRHCSAVCAGHLSGSRVDPCVKGDSPSVPGSRAPGDPSQAWAWVQLPGTPFILCI